MQLQQASSPSLWPCRQFGMEFRGIVRLSKEWNVHLVINCLGTQLPPSLMENPLQIQGRLLFPGNYCFITVLLGLTDMFPPATFSLEVSRMLCLMGLP